MELTRSGAVCRRSTAHYSGPGKRNHRLGYRSALDVREHNWGRVKVYTSNAITTSRIAVTGLLTGTFTDFI